MHKLTQEEQDHLNSTKATCVFCESKNTKFNETSHTNGQTWVKVFCHDCRQDFGKSISFALEEVSIDDHTCDGILNALCNDHEQVKFVWPKSIVKQR